MKLSGARVVVTGASRRQVLPGMIVRRRGHIVNISSLAGAIAAPGLALS